jgi:hypothetical protein
MFLIIFLAFLVLSALFIFIRKLVLKGRLERGLGRKVNDRELMSISAWMDTNAESGSTHGQPQTPAVTQPQRRKRGDLIALVIGILGVLLVPLSIIASRINNDRTIFERAYIVEILIFLVGLPLAFIAFWRAKKLPALYGGSGRSLLAILANLALGGCVIAITVVIMFWSIPFYTLLTSPRIERVYRASPSPSPTPGVKTSEKSVARKKREDLIRSVNADWMARKLYDVTAVPMGDNYDQLVITSFDALPRSKSDSLAKELIAKRGKEFATAGFANTFKFHDRKAAVSATYEFKSIDVLARETALTIAELWFLSQKQVKAKATLDPADDTKLVVTSPSFTDSDQIVLAVEFSAKNGKNLKGLGFTPAYTVTNGTQSWTHQLY